MKKRKLTSRERSLAILCAVVAGIMFVRFGVLNPRRGIRGNLDEEIEKKEARLMFLTEAKQLAVSVDEDYNRYRMMMSDERTEEEVRNKLQEAIYVLASKAAVTIPTIKQGSTDSFAYYKRYLVTVDIQGTAERVANFMALLEESPMLLHVEKLIIDRRGDNKVKGQLTVSRSLVPSAEHDLPASEDEPATAPAIKLLTAVSTPPAPANMMFNGGFEDWDNNDKPNGWKIWKVETDRDTEKKVEGTVACRLQSGKSDSYIAQDVTLNSGTRYTWSANAAVEKGKMSLLILEGKVRGFKGRKRAVQELQGSEMIYYEQQFTTPGRLGSTCTVRFQLSFEQANSVVYLDNVTIFAGTGS